MTKKQFALKAISPYFKNPNLCGYENAQCKYLTSDNRKCVFGNFIKDLSLINDSETVIQILGRFAQEDILIEEAVGILTMLEWRNLQIIHDAIAQNHNKDHLKDFINRTNLFTFEELENYGQEDVCS